MGINIHTGRSSGSIEEKRVRGKKARSIAGRNSGRTVHKDEEEVWGIQ